MHIDGICNLFEIQPEELLKQDNFLISYNKGNSVNGYIINQISEKLIALYELRLQEKDKYIDSLEKLLKKYQG